MDIFAKNLSLYTEHFYDYAESNYAFD